MFIGEWAEKRGIRNELVLATKYTTPHKDRDHEAYTGSNYAGNSAKSLHVSLVDSLKKLRTDYIDILYVHWWDWATSVEEMMQSLNRVVQQGKVLYLGASDMPAWVVASANAYARAHGMAEFVVYQGRWNATQRDFEREIIPMCRKEGIALAPWGALGQGRLRTPEQIAEREKELGPLRGGKGQSEAEKATSLTLAKLGKEEFQGASVSQMALAYVFAKYPYVFPIVGGTKTSYIEDNIKAIQLKLTDEQIQKIEDTAEFDWGFPMNMILPDPHLTGKTNFPLVARKCYAGVASCLGYSKGLTRFSPFVPQTLATSTGSRRPGLLALPEVM